MSFQPNEVDDKDILVFNDVLDESESGAIRPEPPLHGENSLKPPERNRPPRAGSPSENSPLKSDQIGPRKPSVECCGFGLGAVVLVTSTVVLAIALSIGLVITIRVGVQQVPPTGAVVSPYKACSDAGLDILKEVDSTSADAVVAMTLCVGVVRAESSGLGGDGFAMYLDHRIAEHGVFSARSCSGDNVTPLSNAVSNSPTGFEPFKHHGWAVATPTQLALLYNLHAKKGKKPWNALFEPAIKVAQEGFQLTPETHTILSSPLFNLSQFRTKMPTIASFYLNGDSLKNVNETIKRPDLAQLLQQIRDNTTSLKYFQEGTPALNIQKAIADHLDQGQQSLFSTFNLSAQHEKCLANFTMATPFSASFNNYSVYYPGLPSTAFAIADILGVISASNFSEEKWNDDNHGPFSSFLIEATKFSLVRLFEASDDVSVENHNGTQQEYWNTINAKIGKNPLPQQWVDYSGSDTKVLDKLPNVETTGNFIAAIDEHEQFVAISTSLGSPFGSMIETKDGVVLNNHMEAFYYDKRRSQHANYIGNNKRPWSAQSPMVAHVPRSCKVRTAMGSFAFSPATLGEGNESKTEIMPWNTIATQAEVLARVLLSDNNPLPLDTFRFSPLPLTGSPKDLVIEGNLKEYTEFVAVKQETISHLTTLGYNIRKVDKPLTIASVTAKENNALSDQIDPRSPSSVAEHFGSK